MNESKGSQISKYEISSLEMQDPRSKIFKLPHNVKDQTKYLKNFRCHDPRLKDLMYNPKMTIYLHYGNTGWEVFIRGIPNFVP